MGHPAFLPSGWVLIALAETPIQLLALTPISNHSIEKEPVCSRIYLEKNSNCFFLKWNGSQRWALVSELRGRRKVCSEQGSQLSGCFVLFCFPPNSRETPSTDLGLRGHSAYLPPWLQTSGLPSTSSQPSTPLVSGLKQRQPLLLLPSPGNITLAVHSAQH